MSDKYLFTDSKGQKRIFSDFILFQIGVNTQELVEGNQIIDDLTFIRVLSDLDDEDKLLLEDSNLVIIYDFELRKDQEIHHIYDCTLLRNYVVGPAKVTYNVLNENMVDNFPGELKDLGMHTTFRFKDINSFVLRNGVFIYLGKLSVEDPDDMEILNWIKEEGKTYDYQSIFNLPEIK